MGQNMIIEGLVEDKGHLIWAISYRFIIWAISFGNIIWAISHGHFCMNFNSKSTNWKTKILFEKPVIIGFETI